MPPAPWTEHSFHSMVFSCGPVSGNLSLQNVFERPLSVLVYISIFIPFQSFIRLEYVHIPKQHTQEGVQRIGRSGDDITQNSKPKQGPEC